MSEIVDAREWMTARQQLWTAYREDLVVHQPVNAQPFPFAAAVTNCRVRATGHEIDQVSRSAQANVEIGMLKTKWPQAWQQPFRCERVKRGNGERTLVGAFEQLLGGEA